MEHASLKGPVFGASLQRGFPGPFSILSGRHEVFIRFVPGPRPVNYAYAVLI